MFDDKQSLPVVPLAISGGVMLLGILLLCGAAYTIFILPERGDQAASAQPTAVIVERTMSFPTVTVAPTDTPPPTATDTPIPSETPIPTNTSLPTNPPPPPATNTPAPPTLTFTPVPPTATLTPSHGLTNISFKVRKTNVSTSENIWFEFSVTNGSGETLRYGRLGAVTLNASFEVVDKFQTSWFNSELSPGQTLNWDDHRTPIGQPGTYYLQLAICLSPDASQCGERLESGNWVRLSDPVQVTVN